MRPTGLGHGVYKDVPDYSIFCGEWCIGRIIRRALAAGLRWFWALHTPSKPGTMRISNQVATLDEAKAEFEASWKQWKAWAKMGRYRDDRTPSIRHHHPSNRVRTRKGRARKALPEMIQDTYLQSIPQCEACGPDRRDPEPNLRRTDQHSETRDVAAIEAVIALAK